MDLIDTDGYLLLRFVSEKRSTLATFPWWDIVDILAKTPEFTPVGRLDDPFDDLEQGWQILIWEHYGWVYIMEGEEPQCTEFPVWFKTTKKRFDSQLTALKHTLKPE